MGGEARRNTTGVERVQRREPRIQRHIGFSGNQVRRGRV